MIRDRRVFPVGSRARRSFRLSFSWRCSSSTRATAVGSGSSRPGWIKDTALVTLPAEAFAAIGLEIKSRSPFPNTFVIGVANGMVGYIPTEQAFERGGYECTLSMGSKLDPSAARLLTEAAIELLRRIAE